MLAGCTAATPPTPSGSEVFGAAEVDPLIEQMAVRSIGSEPVSRLSADLVPPTNRWFSGMVFGEEPLPVFPLPLSFALTATGFTFGVPVVQTTADSIVGPMNPAVTIDTGSATSSISAYDDASVTIDQLDASGGVLGSVVIAEGSPLVSFTAAEDASLALGAPFEPVSDGVWSTMAGGVEYAVVTEGDLSGAELALTADQTAVWFPVPEGGDVGALAALATPVSGVSLAYEADAESATTTLDYGADEETLIATLPHHRASADTASTCGLGTFDSVYGEMELCASSSLSWTTAPLEPRSSIDVSALSGEDADLLRTQVADDAAAAVEAETPADSYFGGKALYRLANLLDLAHQLGDDASADLVGERLADLLIRWTEPDGCDSRADTCFVYDETGRGIVGLAPSFGSEEFNDHHFHYGYFLYAASVAAQYDPELVDRIRPVMDLVAADIASDGTSAAFPARRPFDVYAGHSWASGYSPFADGNNQESSSEAVLAWNGLALWASATGNAPLETEARWMLANEAASASAYWTDFDRQDPVYEGYAHGIVSLNWGAKRDYSTWFSADPVAKLAIVALPMSPVSDYLGIDPGRVDENVAQATTGTFDVQYGDWLLMYAGLGAGADRSELIRAAQDFPAELIDGGNSRSYMLAWLMSR